MEGRVIEVIGVSVEEGEHIDVGPDMRERLAEMLRAYREGERSLPSYRELAELVA